MSTIIIYIALFIYQSDIDTKFIDKGYLFIGALLCKSLCLVPFVTFEYYLILFEHLFVDSSHYVSSLASASFLDNYQASPSSRGSRRVISAAISPAAEKPKLPQATIAKDRGKSYENIFNDTEKAKGSVVQKNLDE